MTDPKNQTENPDVDAPQELEVETLDQVTAGWGKYCYASYSSDSSASFKSSASPNNGGGGASK